MKKYFICIVALLLALPLAAQYKDIETDIFGDLVYKPFNSNYNASLKKDIFDNLTFSDSRGNEVVYEKKYLDLDYPGIISDEQAKRDLFQRLIRRYSRETNYREKYKVDIFDKVIIEDNRGNRIEEGTDIFGNLTIKEKHNGRETSVNRDIHGTLQYRSGSGTASLGKDIFDKWTYKDSSGNKFEFSPDTWNRLIRRFGSDEEVFRFLLDRFVR